MQSSNRRYVGVVPIGGAKRLACAAILSMSLIACAVCSEGDPGTSPPDLSACTRVEIRWDPSLQEYCFAGMDAQDMLNPAEKEYLRSIEVLVIEDPNLIERFAQKVNEGRFLGGPGSSESGISWSLSRPYVRITCYREDERLTSFTISGPGTNMMTQDGRRFTYRATWGYWEAIEPMEILPYKVRAACVHRLRMLHYVGPLDRRDVRSYPGPDSWCDAMVRFLKSRYIIDEKRVKKRIYSDQQVAGSFLCPGIHESVSELVSRGDRSEPNALVQGGRSMVSHYAMNPNCKPNSPADIVLLFETEAGWNQHGGPELLTFDHHDPKGGCVLLNDGTVKFIRTEEELKQLRWK